MYNQIIKNKLYFKISVLEEWKNIPWDSIFKILATLFFIGFLYFVFLKILATLKREFLKKAKHKKEKSNIEIFFGVLHYLFVVILLIFAFLVYGGNLTGIGVVAGLISAALGWALQRPITGIAAWLMIVIKRPFEIGDRVIIGGIKGDVADITLTHLHIKEIGGTISGEERSGRMILIPNAKLFEENIINYSFQDELILDQVIFTITFDSNLRKAKEIGIGAAKKVLSGYLPQSSISSYARCWFQSSGVNVHIRYSVLASKREEASSKITEEILNEVKKNKEIELAYPHQEVILERKKL